MGAAVLPGAGAGGYEYRRRRKRVLFSFVVFRRVLWIIFCGNFYIELQQFIFQRDFIFFNCPRIVVGWGRRRFVRGRWWWRGRRRLVSHTGCG